MSVRHSCALRALTFAGALAAGAALLAAGAQAQSVQKQCGDEWKAKKTELQAQNPNLKWADFLKECRARMAQSPGGVVTSPIGQPAPANPLKPGAPVATPSTGVAAPATGAATGEAAKKPMSPGRTAEVARQRQCGAEWRAQKAELQAKTPGLKWPQYWSECNKRLKAAGQ
jgi:hypothetical protein